MSFFATLLALLIEQARPLARGNPIHAMARGWIRRVTRSFDAGREHHGWLAWGIALGIPAALSVGVHWLLIETIGWPFAVLWSVAILYVTLGFRQFSHFFTEIRDALNAGDEQQARLLLAQWQQIDASELPRSEIIRHVIEFSILSAHRHVFGVLAWFSILAAIGLGPAGAVLYRFSEFIGRYWQHLHKEKTLPVSEAALYAAQRAWTLIDWLPARITALGFAVVGSFEDAIDKWRNYEATPSSDNDGVILAATGGAVGIELGQVVVGVDAGLESKNSSKQIPQLSHLASIVGLVWRSVVMWMVLLALLTLARFLG
jgi:adenosylcobinamide-phosphate synthase